MATTTPPQAVTLTLSPDAVAVIAGLIAPADGDDDINRNGIFTTEEVWDEIRAAFPVEAFAAWAAARPRDQLLDSGGQGYDPEAGY